MAPLNEYPCFATDNLILASPRNFYKAYMHAGHWQLRAFTHCPTPNIVHYLGWRDIYEVNTSTKVRKILATLPFSARCFTSSNGILCCGGDKGKFCLIRLAETGNATQRQREVDDALDSIDRMENPWLPPSARALARADLPSEEPAPEVEDESFGTELVNCINLWFPNDDAEEGTHNRPVAVIASNDGHIYIADLQTKELVQKLPHDQPVNMGKISPDGSLLVVVGDDPYLHIYKRKRVTGREKNSSASDTWEWEKFSQTRLPGQRVGNEDETRGSFTGSFSHRYLAIGEQFGHVAIFEIRDIQNLQYPRPTVIFKCTRPNTKQGAIRSLHFNPNSSLDLLAITEDNGRVLVVDVRQFGRQQTLETDQDAGGYDDVPLKPMRSHHISNSAAAAADADTTDDESAYSNALVRQERAHARLATRTHISDDIDALYAHGNRRLSPEEMSVLLAMQAQRRRREWQARAPDRERRERETAAISASSPTPGALEPARRYAPTPHSHDRLRVMNETLGHSVDPNRTVEARERASATQMAIHRRRMESREARFRETGQEPTLAEAGQQERETRTALAMARMLSLDAENARRQAEAALIAAVTPAADMVVGRGSHWLAERVSAGDIEALRAHGFVRTARTVQRITNDIRRIEAMDRARRERDGETIEVGDTSSRIPFPLSREASGRSQPWRTARLPASIEPGPSDSSLPQREAAADALLHARRRYLPTLPSPWSGGFRTFMNDPEYEESLSPDARQAFLRRRELSQLRSLVFERDATRGQQNLGWIPPEAVMNHEDGRSNLVAPPALRNQTTGCAWSPDGRTLYVGTEGGLYEYHVNVQDRRIHPAFELR